MRARVVAVSQGGRGGEADGWNYCAGGETREDFFRHSHEASIRS